MQLDLGTEQDHEQRLPMTQRRCLGDGELVLLFLHGILALSEIVPITMRQKVRFELEPHHRNTPDDTLIADLWRVAVETKSSSVTIDQYNERGRYHATTLTRRFGSWFKALDLAGLSKTRNLNIQNEELFENLVEVWTRLGSLNTTSGDTTGITAMQMR
ncbi:MAG: hypothetical protein P4L52_02595 [Acidocella sp.]|nr:hypothetical protein [Acidocella sp.]